MRVAEQITGVILGLLGAAMLVGSAGLPAGRGGDLGPAVFPRILGGACIVAAVAVWLEARRTPRGEPPEVNGRWRLAMGGLGISAAYFALIPLAGYFVATPLFLGGMAYSLGMRSPRWLLGTAVGFTVVAWLLFVLVLAVPLPNGILDGVLG